MSSLKINCVVFSRAMEEGETKRPLGLSDAWFGDTDRDVILHFRALDLNQVERYQRIHDQWQLIESVTGDAAVRYVSAHRGAGSIAAATLSISVRQSLNVPPALWATNVRSGRSKELWNPNPQFSTIKFGDASVYHWKDKSGYEWIGGLVKPVDYVQGTRYPLILQAHGFHNAGEFITDGAFPTAMAARQLASDGMVVLQIRDRHTHDGTLQEASDHVLGFAAAVDQLASEGLIDAKRVGIVGFSRTCWYVESALIQDPERYAAAVISNGVDASYMQHMLYVVGNGKDHDSVLYGAAPFGGGLRRWLDLAPGFNLAKVRAPLRLEAAKANSILSEWEIYSSLREQGKPVDLVYIPNGQHILQKPLERMASKQGTVDWFRFWQQNYEDPDQGKAAQYVLWRRFKAMGDESVGRGR